jgi:hypothetical protein
MGSRQNRKRWDDEGVKRVASGQWLVVGGEEARPQRLATEMTGTVVERAGDAAMAANCWHAKKSTDGTHGTNKAVSERIKPNQTSRAGIVCCNCTFCWKKGFAVKPRQTLSTQETGRNMTNFGDTFGLMEIAARRTSHAGAQKDLFLLRLGLCLRVCKR